MKYRGSVCNGYIKKREAEQPRNLGPNYNQLMGSEQTERPSILSPSSYDEIVRRLEKLVPLNVMDKSKYLMDLIDYVNALLNGDDIEAFTTATSDSAKRYAKEAIETLVQMVQANSIEDLKAKLAALSNEIEIATQKRNELLGENKKLSEQKDSLSKDVLEMQETLKNKGELDEAFEKLKKEIEAYNEAHRQSDSIVTWKQVDENSPIYHVCAKNIDNYINALIKEYALQTGCSEELADSIFDMNCPGLSAVRSNLETIAKIDQSCSSLSISGLIKTIKNVNWSGYDNLVSIRSILKTLKLPSYAKRKTDLDKLFELGMSSDTVGAVLETKLKGMVVAAEREKKIANLKLKRAIAILSQVMSNFDESMLIESKTGISPVGVKVKNKS